MRLPKPQARRSFYVGNMGSKIYLVTVVLLISCAVASATDNKLTCQTDTTIPIRTPDVQKLANARSSDPALYIRLVLTPQPP
jgi:hypothetical protein